MPLSSLTIRDKPDPALGLLAHYFAPPWALAPHLCRSSERNHPVHFAQHFIWHRDFPNGPQNLGGAGLAVQRPAPRPRPGAGHALERHFQDEVEGDWAKYALGCDWQWMPMKECPTMAKGNCSISQNQPHAFINPNFWFNFRLR
jgi:hypothetical protein